MTAATLALSRRPRVEVRTATGQVVIVAYPRTAAQVALLEAEADALGGEIVVRYRGGNHEPLTEAARRSNTAFFCRNGNTVFVAHKPRKGKP